MELQLVVVAEPDGEPQAFHFPDFERVTLGRGPDSPVPLSGSSLSRDHVRFELREHALFVTDISSNGSAVNGRRLEQGAPHELEPGDEVRIPGYRIRPRLIGQEATAPEPAPQTDDTEALPKSEVKRAPNPGPEPEGKAPEPARTGFRLSTLEWFVILLLLAVVVLVAAFFSY